MPSPWNRRAVESFPGPPSRKGRIILTRRKRPGSRIERRPSKYIAMDTTYTQGSLEEQSLDEGPHVLPNCDHSSIHGSRRSQFAGRKTELERYVVFAFVALFSVVFA
eukprot:GHVT01023554.1.p1 GENE.GHVT01023554.1~~GHVT01023554.1.p1  ORF type:complete len:107 (-),score=3.54 GHVT01023554.1:27-347(-)